MQILVVTATELEIGPLVARFHDALTLAPRLRRYTYSGHTIDVLTTGVGMVAAAAWCSRTLARGSYDLALNFGVCGSFDPAFAPGAVVHVTRDRIAELGAEDDDRFLTIHELKLLDEDEPPYAAGWLVNGAPPENPVLRALPAVRAVTVNTAHGNERSIEALVGRFAPQVESMEGAAFLYCCLTQGVPCAQVRAVSNRMEKRNRDAWRMGDAIRALVTAAAGMIEQA